MRARFAMDGVTPRGTLDRLPGPSPVDIDTLQPGSVVYEEPGVDACDLNKLSANAMDTAVVVVADEQGTLYGMYLRGGVRDAEAKPYGPLYPLNPSSRLFATQAEALLAQAESERDEARQRLRLADRLQEMAAELQSRGR